jgi:hypothetical protein
MAVSVPVPGSTKATTISDNECQFFKTAISSRRFSPKQMQQDSGNIRACFLAAFQGEAGQTSSHLFVPPEPIPEKELRVGYHFEI